MHSLLLPHSYANFAASRALIASAFRLVKARTFVCIEGLRRCRDVTVAPIIIPQMLSFREVEERALVDYGNAVAEKDTDRKGSEEQGRGGKKICVVHLVHHATL